MINVSDELVELSRGIVETIENEDREYDFKQNRGYVERNISASKFKKKVMGLGITEIGEIIKN